MERFTDDHLDRFRTFIGTRRWRKATSAAQQRWPHEYTVRDWSSDEDGFVEAVRIIRCYGHTEKFFKHIRIYLLFDGIKYWTMGDTLAETVVINRADPESVFGLQNAPTSPSNPLTVYDWLATEYDERYSDATCQAENQIIAVKIRALTPRSILDIGCGTGLAVEMMPEIKPSTYLGVEPSRGMFNEFLRKHPAYPIVGRSLNELTTTKDLALALFGVASYLPPSDIELIPTLANRWFLMFYRDGYMPDYWSSDDQWVAWQNDSLDMARNLPNAATELFRNFVIVVGQT